MVQFIDKPMPTKVAPKFVDTPITGGVSFIDTPMPTPKGLSGGQKAGAFGVGLAQGVSDVGQNIIGRPVGYISNKITQGLEGTKIGNTITQKIQNLAKKVVGEKALQEFQKSEQAKRQQPGYNPAISNIITDTNLLTPEQQQSGWASGGREVGKFIGTTALTLPLGGIIGAGGKAIGMAGSTLGRIGLGGLQGAAQTQVANLGSEGQFASAGETALGAGLGSTISALGEGGKVLKNKLYNSAFSQTKDSTKKTLAGYGQTAGEAVQEQNLSPSVKKGLVQIKEKLGNTWTVLENTANKAGDVNGSSVRQGLKKDLVEKLGYNTLNQKAQSTKDLINKLYSVVDDMIPNGKIKPSEIVQQIKQINSTLPNTLMGKGFQDLKGNSKITKVIEGGLKDVLDKAAGGNGKIQQLYQTYGKQKTVQSILKDEGVRKIMGRQLIGAGAGTTIGGIAGIEDFKKGDILGGLSKVALYGVGGATMGTLAKNPSFLMKLGNIAEKTLSKANNAKTSILSYLSSKLKK